MVPSINSQKELIESYFIKNMFKESIVNTMMAKLY